MATNDINETYFTIWNGTSGDSASNSAWGVPSPTSIDYTYYNFDDAGVGLYYDGVKKFETIAGGTPLIYNDHNHSKPYNHQTLISVKLNEIIGTIDAELLDDKDYNNEIQKCIDHLKKCMIEAPVKKKSNFLSDDEVML